MTPRRPDPATLLAAAWTLAGAGASLAGWTLSALGALNAAGWAAALAILAGGLASGGWGRRRALARGAWWRRVAARMRRPLPRAWLLVFVLAAVGGAVHVPNNVDALTYRLPRVLHWLAADGWHWIATNDPRMNYSATGVEWQMAPVLALARSDRPLFLLNLLPAALLPGLVFSFFRRAGVSPRVAWRWMWLLPLAGVFVLQAGSIANDAIGAAYFLAAAHFAAVAAGTGRRGWLVLALAAAGLMTGVKASNLALALPLAVVLWPARPRTGAAVPAAVLGLGAALAVSALPTLALNHHHSGHWSGEPPGTTGVRVESPLAGLAGNLAQGAVQNLAPPVLPGAARWNAWSAATLEPAVRRVLGDEFPRFTLRLGELPQEEWSGLGLVVVALLLGGTRGRWTGNALGRQLAGAGLVAAAVFGATMGSEMTARLLAPYYPVLALPLLCRAGQGRWSRSRAAAAFAGLHVAATVLALLVSPARPLLPVARLAALARERGGALAERAATVYEAYALRADPLAPLRRALPPDVETLGFLATGDDSEISAWRPYGSRRVQRLRSDGTPTGWLFVRADAVWPSAADEVAWLERHRATVVRRMTVRIKAARSPEQWALVRVSPADSAAAP
ncbi:MAG TPA: hypothetical protein VEB66_04680 [Opitutaceae bacterium]|nr:hypothetical protein [Opitutaceae bacterium]